MEEYPKTREDDKKTISVILRLSVSASLAALGIVLSTAVVLFPNIEFISMTIFLISLLFGAYYGVLASVSIALIYELIVLLMGSVFKKSMYNLLHNSKTTYTILYVVILFWILRNVTIFPFNFLAP